MQVGTVVSDLPIKTFDSVEKGSLAAIKQHFKDRKEALTSIFDFKEFDYDVFREGFRWISLETDYLVYDKKILKLQPLKAKW